VCVCVCVCVCACVRIRTWLTKSTVIDTKKKVIRSRFVRVILAQGPC
jgi:hypothetical protein